MGIVTALLARRRLEAFVAVAFCVGTWFIVAPHLGRVGLWSAIAIVSFAVLPGTLLLVLIALPLYTARWLLPAVVLLALVALVCSLLGFGLAANFAKLWAAVFAGWAFLALFVSHTIPAGWPRDGAPFTFVSDGVESAVARAKAVAGDKTVGVAGPNIAQQCLNAGLLDEVRIAARWNLRVGWTWFAMTYTYGLTIVIANAADVAGLPALPFLSAAFLAANADLLWAAIRRSEDSSSSSPSSSGDDPAPS